jgi:hypothetical protein
MQGSDYRVAWQDSDNRVVAVFPARLAQRSGQLDTLISLPTRGGLRSRHDRSAEGMDVDYVIPLHCTGELFYEMAKAEMPNQLLRSYMGTRLIFAA